jgi:hypothetical protein
MDCPEIIIFDAAMAPAARINSYTSFQWDHNWYDLDTFEILTNRYKQNVDELVEGGFIAYLNPLGTFLGEYCVGCVDSIEKPLDENGKISEIWTVDGRGIESVLANRQMMHAWATGDGYDTQNSYAETNNRHYMTYEVISATDTNRRMAGITLETNDGHRGIAIEYKARAPLDLLTVLRDHNIQSGLSYRLIWSKSGKNFVYTTLAGTDRSTGAGKVTLSVDFGNVKAYDYIYSVLDQRNFVYIGGPGDGAARTLQSVPTSSIPTGWTRRETFVDASECTTAAERTAKGNQVLAERAATQTLDFTFDQTAQTFVLGTDFNLGDTVVVDFPGVATMTSRITRITERYDVEKGRTYEIGVGKSAPDLISIIARQGKKIAGLSTR